MTSADRPPGNLPSPPSVTLVVRCLNEEAHIGRLLTGVMRQTVTPSQIVVVDSGSTDATLAIAGRFGVDITTIEPTKFSFGRALNLGCSLARGDVLVIASAHVYPLYDSWIEELVRPFASPKISVAYGRQVGDHETHYSERQILRRWFPDESDLDQAHPFCNNANAAIRRSVWESYPYDEEFDRARRYGMGPCRARARGGPGVCRGSPRCARPPRAMDTAHEPVPARGDRAPAHPARSTDREARSDPFGIREHCQRLPACGAGGPAGPERHVDPVVPIRPVLGDLQGFAQRGEVSSVLRRRFYYPNGMRRRSRGRRSPPRVLVARSTTTKSAPMRAEREGS